ncbi:MAG: hypothetical protein WC916_01295 [Candidatus Woesearchaeota archaeon]
MTKLQPAEVIAMAKDLHENIAALTLNAEGTITTITNAVNSGKLNSNDKSLDNTFLALRSARDRIVEARKHLIDAGAGRC